MRGNGQKAIKELCRDVAKNHLFNSKDGGRGGIGGSRSAGENRGAGRGVLQQRRTLRGSRWLEKKKCGGKDKVNSRKN